MPPASHQDSQSSGGGNSSLKVSQKQGGKEASSKNAKKNGQAKDGGVTAAVAKTFNASKSSSLLSGQIAQSSSADNKPDSTSMVGNQVASPPLEALPSAALSANASPAHEWGKGVQTFSGSPGNLISLGESPPVLPSSLDERRASSRWNHLERDSYNGHLSSTSPPSNHRRPLSYQYDGFPVFDDQLSLRPSNPHRRSSIYSQNSQRFGSGPPLPHHPQAHFYGAPNADFGLPSRKMGLKPGDKDYFCGFDKLSTTHPALQNAESAMITGFEGGFDVFRVTKRGYEKIISLSTLRGGVYWVKILPGSLTESQDPLAAIVVHGPVWNSTDNYQSLQTQDAESEARPQSMRSPPRGTSPYFGEGLGQITHYQTTVEIYSLLTKERVATVLSLPPIPVPARVTASPLFVPPAPSGALTINANRKNLVIASGVSGEVWIFKTPASNKGSQRNFSCIGKVWTTIHHGSFGESLSPSSSSSIDGDDGLPDSSTPRQQTNTALLSLSGRWLAYGPAAASSQMTLRASIPLLSGTSRIPGINSQAPPHLPPSNCGVDIPDAESVINRFTREVAQELLKGAKWVGDQGMQAFKSYWNKPATTHYGNTPNQQWHGNNHLEPNNLQQFPPTHASANQQYNNSSIEPSLISILDLDGLASHSSSSSHTPPQPFVTFKAPLGCSFLSFAPNGLLLLTVSSKGDVQFVWDLMKIQRTKPSMLQIAPFNGTMQTPHVREITHFTRMTVAKVVDVLWAFPYGDKAALVTEHGTVHILELPASSLAWPPLRLRTKAPVSNQAVAAPGHPEEGTTSAAGVAMNAFSAAWKTVQVNRPQRSNSGPGLSGITAASVTAHAGHGGKVIAKGISKSFGAATGTIGNIRKSGEKRVRLPPGAAVPTAACVKWMRGKNGDSIATVRNGIVRIYVVKDRGHSTAPDKPTKASGAKSFEYQLPWIPDHKFAPAILQGLDVDDDLQLADKNSDDTKWNMSQPLTLYSAATGTESSIPQAEIESNAPYQPFHTDKRVALSVYPTGERHESSPSVSALFSSDDTKLRLTPSFAAAADVEVGPWAFGVPIPATRLNLGHAEVAGDVDDYTEQARALPSSDIERITKIAENVEEGEQIVVTTRRRKRAARTDEDSFNAADDDGFFEDDCEILDFASQRV